MTAKPSKGFRFYHSRVLATQAETKWEILDCQNQVVVGVFSNRTRARGKAERLNLEYGASRYSVRPVGGWQALAVA